MHKKIANDGFPKFKIMRYIVPLALIGAMAGVVLVKFTNLEDTLRVIRTMPVWLVGLALLAQICSYLGSGFVLSAIMDIGESSLSIMRGALITMASASIGLIAGGWVVSSATTYFWTSKTKYSAGEATLTGILPSIYNTIVLIIITVIGIINLLLNHSLSKTQLITYSSLLGVTLLIVGVAITGIKKQQQVERVLVFLVRFMNRFKKQKKDIMLLREDINKFYEQTEKLTLKEWLYPGLGSLANTIFDILTLYFCFIAAGYRVKISILVSGYSLALLLARAAFFMPGGIGVIEGGLTAIFSSLGVASHFSVVAVLVYRLISFWLPTSLGFLSTIYLKRTTPSKANP